MANPITSRRALLTGIAAAAGGSLLTSMPSRVGASTPADLADADIRGIDKAAANALAAQATCDAVDEKRCAARGAAEAEIAALPHKRAYYVQNGRRSFIDTAQFNRPFLEQRMAQARDPDASIYRALRRTLAAHGEREREAARIKDRHQVATLHDEWEGAADRAVNALAAFTAYPVRTLEGLLHKLDVMASDSFQVFGDNPHDDEMLADLRRIAGKEA